MLYDDRHSDVCYVPNEHAGRDHVVGRGRSGAHQFAGLADRYAAGKEFQPKTQTQLPKNHRPLPDSQYDKDFLFFVNAQNAFFEGTQEF